MLTDEQLAIRRTGIGGSEAPAVLGIDPYRTPLDVWLSKVEGYQPPVTGPMERGTFLEDGVARWYAHRTGATLTEPGTIRHATRPLVLCTPDRIAHSAETPHRLLSIKVPGPYVREQWGDEWSEDVPLAYLMQLQWEDAILSSGGASVDPEFHLAAPIDGDLRIYKLHRDRELQEGMMETVERWWRDHVETKTPPPIDGSNSCTEWMKRRFPRNTAPLLQADASHEVLALALQEAEVEFDAAEKTKEAAKNRLKDVIGEAEGIEGVFGRITWRANVKGVRSFKPSWKKT